MALASSSAATSNDFLYSQLPPGKNAVAACPAGDRSMAIMASWGKVADAGSDPEPTIISMKELAFGPTVQPSLKGVLRMDRHPMPPGMLSLS